MKYKNIFSFAIGPILSAILGIVSLPIIAWYFPVSDIGRFSILQLSISFSVLIYSLGLDQSFIREYSNSYNKPSTFISSYILGLCLIITSGLVLFTFEPYLISLFLYGISSIELSVLTYFSVIISYLNRFFSLVFRMENKGKLFSMVQFIPKLLTTLLIIITINFTSHTEFSLILYSFFSSSLITFIYICWNLRDFLCQQFKAKIDFSELKKMLVFGLPLVPGGLAVWALTAMDKYFLKDMVGFSELGIYSIAFSIASAATILGTVFNIIWAPMVYNWINGDNAHKKVNSVYNYMEFFCIVIICLVGMFSWLVPYLLPVGYEQVKILIPVLVLSPLLYTLSEVSSIGIGVTKRTHFAMLASILTAAINILGNYLLIPYFGAAGAAFSTVISMFVYFILRTEFSSFLWGRVGTIKVYPLIIGIIIILLTGMYHPIYISPYAWILYLIIYVYFKKYLFKDILSYIFNSLEKRNN